MKLFDLKNSKTIPKAFSFFGQDKNLDGGVLEDIVAE